MSVAPGLRMSLLLPLLCSVLPLAEPLQVRDIVRDIVVERSGLPPTIAVNVADALMDESIAQGVDPTLVLAMIEVESQWKENARSRAGARGYLQLMPRTKRWMIERDTDLAVWVGSEQDVRVAVRYLALLQSVFGPGDRALQAYNCGPGCVIAAKRGRAVLPRETQQYPGKVRATYRRYKRSCDEALASAVTQAPVVATLQ